MKLGVHCANLTWPGGPDALGTTLAGVARAADEGGVTTLTMMDHYFQMEHLGGPPEPMLEGYTSLGFLAGQTSRIELGLLVTGVTYRHPGLLAKIVTTLDVLSRGRAMLGLGAAWYEREHRGLGVPYPSDQGALRAPRGDPADRAAGVGRRGGAYDGAHYRLEELTLVPQPLRAGRPADRGRRHAASARRCGWSRSTPTPATCSPPSVDEVAHKLDVLRGHCDDVGRDYDEVSKTHRRHAQPSRSTTSTRWLATMEEYADLGITQVWVGPDPADPVGWTEQMCDTGAPPSRRDRRLTGGTRDAPPVPRYLLDMPSGRLVLLNGPSSSGKTTLAKAVVGRLRTPWLLLPVDLFHQIRTRPDADLTDRQWQDVFHRTRAAYHRALVGAAACGCDVLGDHVLSEPWRLDDLLRLSVGLDVLLVHVTCDPAELGVARRHAATASPGTARTQQRLVFAHGDCDLTVDTTHGPDEPTAAVLELIRRPPADRAFDRLRASGAAMREPPTGVDRRRRPGCGTPALGRRRRPGRAPARRLRRAPLGGVRRQDGPRLFVTFDDLGADDARRRAGWRRRTPERSACATTASSSCSPRCPHRRAAPSPCPSPTAP